MKYEGLHIQSPLKLSSKTILYSFAGRDLRCNKEQQNNTNSCRLQMRSLVFFVFAKYNNANDIFLQNTVRMRHDTK